MFCEKTRFNPFFILFIFLVILLIGIAGCNQRLVTPTSTIASGGHLTPYLTATPSPDLDLQNSNQESSLVQTDIPLPSPTPFIYTVVANDTLTGIAFRYSVPLEDLIAANPGVDPNFLTIGLTLTIPLEGGTAAALPSPTPIPIVIQAPDCYVLASNELHCLVMIENNHSYSVENVIVEVSLLSSDGKIMATKTAIPPLNLLPAGKNAAVPVIFDNPSPQDFNPQVNLLTVIPVAQDSQRYLKTDIQTQERIISPSGLQAQIRGSISLQDEQPDATLVWIAAFAYDENENIVGLRKWVSNDVLVFGEPIDFDLTVYSLGPVITRIELISETRP